MIDDSTGKEPRPRIGDELIWGAKGIAEEIKDPNKKPRTRSIAPVTWSAPSGCELAGLPAAASTSRQKRHCRRTSRAWRLKFLCGGNTASARDDVNFDADVN